MCVKRLLANRNFKTKYELKAALVKRFQSTSKYGYYMFTELVAFIL